MGHGADVIFHIVLHQQPNQPLCCPNQLSEVQSLRLGAKKGQFWTYPENVKVFEKLGDKVCPKCMAAALTQISQESEINYMDTETTKEVFDE